MNHSHPTQEFKWLSVHLCYYFRFFASISCLYSSTYCFTNSFHVGSSSQPSSRWASVLLKVCSLNPSITRVVTLSPSKAMPVRAWSISVQTHTLTDHSICIIVTNHDVSVSVITCRPVPSELQDGVSTSSSPLTKNQSWLGSMEGRACRSA